MEKNTPGLVSCPQCASNVRVDRLEKHNRLVHTVSKIGSRILSKRKHKKYSKKGSVKTFMIFNRDKGVNSYMGSNYIYGETDT